MDVKEAEEFIGGPSLTSEKLEGRLKILKAQERGEERRSEKGVRVADDDRVRPNVTYRKLMLTLRRFIYS